MTNVINVTLKANAPGLLSVIDNGGQNVVNAAPQAQTIQWELTGAAARGRFLSMSADPPGFSWKVAPPDGIFGEPVIGANGNSLSITDTHTGPATDGAWIYTLRMELDGTIYCTTTSAGVGGTTNDPNIINR
jgi:hypothetical protein